MTDKSAFTDDEWKAIVDAPLLVSLAMFAAGQHGPISMVKEASASARGIARPGERGAATALIAQISPEAESREARHDVRATSRQVDRRRHREHAHRSPARRGRAREVARGGGGRGRRLVRRHRPCRRRREQGCERRRAGDHRQDRRALRRRTPVLTSGRDEPLDVGAGNGGRHRYSASWSSGGWLRRRDRVRSSPSAMPSSAGCSTTATTRDCMN